MKTVVAGSKLPHRSAERLSGGIRNRKRDHASLALHHSKDRSTFPVAAHRPSYAAFASSAVVHFVHFYALAVAANRPVIGKHRANLLEHAPSGLVGNARLPLNLLGRDAATGRGHQVNCMEPDGQRRTRLVKDRVRCGVNMVPAMVAGIRGTTGNAVMFGHLFAGLAENTVRVEEIAEPFEASCVVRKLALHFLERERQHFRLLVHSITYSQGKVCQNLYLLSRDIYHCIMTFDFSSPLGI